MPPAPYYDVAIRPGDGAGVIDGFSSFAINLAVYRFDRDGLDLISERLAGLLGVDRGQIWMHRCPCGALFLAAQTRRICNACRIERPRQRVRAYTARLAKPHAAACEHCGETLTAQRGTKRFCSTRCRMAHHRAQPAATEAELQPADAP